MKITIESTTRVVTIVAPSGAQVDARVGEGTTLWIETQGMKN